MTSVSRGDIVWVTFPDDDDLPDEEFDNPHPAVVIQNDTENHHLDSTVVVPITTSKTTATEQFEVELRAPSDGVEDDGVATLDMISSVSVPGRIMEVSEDPEVWKMGEISVSKLNEIENRLEVLLSLH